MNIKFINDTFASVCFRYPTGITCLAAIIKYYKGEADELQLIKMSETSQGGSTTLLGLYQTANDLGFNAEAYKTDIEGLKQTECPVILFVDRPGGEQDFFVCYGFEKKFLIGDPAWGLTQFSADELESVWTSNVVLELEPSSSFKPKGSARVTKIKWLGNFIREDRIFFNFALIFGFLSVLTLPFETVFLKKFMNNVFPEGVFSTYKPFIIFSALFLIRLFSGYCSDIFRSGFIRDFNDRCTDWFSRLFVVSNQSRNLEDWNDKKNLDEFRAAAAHIIPFISKDIPVILVSLIVSACYFLFPVLIFSLILSGLVLLIQINFKKKSGAQTEVVRKLNVRINNYFSTIIRNKTSGLNLRRNGLKNNLHVLTERHAAENYRLNIQRNQFRHQYTIMLFMSVLVFVILVFVTNTKPDAGVLLAISWLLIFLINSLSRWPDFVFHFQNFTKGLNNIFYADKGLNKNRVEKAGVHNFNNMHAEELKYFPARADGFLLDGINLTCKTGRITAITGDSGFETKALLEILAGIQTETEGSILLDGIDRNDISDEVWRKDVKNVFHIPVLFEDTVLSNIHPTIKPEETQRIIDFLISSGFDEVFDSLPDKYDEEIKCNGANLPTGFPQLIAILRAVYNNPKALFLYEPFLGMDENMEKLVLNLLHKIKYKTLIVLVTNKKHTFAEADMVYRIQRGRVVSPPSFR